MYWKKKLYMYVILYYIYNNFYITITNIILVKCEKLHILHIFKYILSLIYLLLFKIIYVYFESYVKCKIFHFWLILYKNYCSHK